MNTKLSWCHSCEKPFKDCKCATGNASARLPLLYDLLTLEKGWDGYDGIAPSQLTIDKVRDIVERLPGYNWQFVPGEDGSVQAECHENGFDIDINVLAV